MKNNYQQFMAFFIPFSAAILLVCGYFYLFPTYQPAEGISFSISDELPPLEKQIYVSLIFSLFFLSFFLPAIVDLRKEPIERTELKLTGEKK